MSEPSAATLAYATPNTDGLVTYFRDGERAAVVIRRPGRRAKKAGNATGDLLGEGLLYYVVGLAILAYVAPWWLFVVLPGGVGVVVAVWFLYWLWYARLDEPIVVEVTPTELAFCNLDGSARPHVLGREGLYAIRYAGHAKCIFVYRRNQEMYAFYAGPEEAAEAERIAEFLREAAGLGVAGA